MNNQHYGATPPPLTRTRSAARGPQHFLDGSQFPSYLKTFSFIFILLLPAYVCGWMVTLFLVHYKLEGSMDIPWRLVLLPTIVQHLFFAFMTLVFILLLNCALQRRHKSVVLVTHLQRVVSDIAVAGLWYMVALHLDQGFLNLRSIAGIYWGCLGFNFILFGFAGKPADPLIQPVKPYVSEVSASILSSILIVCKIDGVGDYSWGMAFFFQWIAAAALLISGLAMLCMMVPLVRVSRERGNSGFLLALLPMSLVVGMCVSFTIFLAKLTQRLDGAQDVSINEITFPVLFFSGCVLFFVLLLVPILFVIRIIIRQTRNGSQNGSQNRTLQQMQNFMSRAPAFLVRRSDGYFARANDLEAQQAIAPTSSSSSASASAAPGSAVEAALTRVQSEQVCYICADSPQTAVFMECGHGGVCVECAQQQLNTKGECPVCRQKLSGVVEISSISDNNVVKVKVVPMPPAEDLRDDLDLAIAIQASHDIGVFCCQVGVLSAA